LFHVELMPTYLKYVYLITCCQKGYFYRTQFLSVFIFFFSKMGVLKSGCEKKRRAVYRRRFKSSIISRIAFVISLSKLSV